MDLYTNLGMLRVARAEVTDGNTKAPPRVEGG